MSNSRCKTEKFPEQHRRATLDEARKGTVYVEGLIDAKSCEEFGDKLVLLKPIWEGEKQIVKATLEVFLKTTRQMCNSSVICPVCEQAWLGSPPEQFTTNASVSLNAVIKSNEKRSLLTKQDAWQMIS